MLEFSKQQQQYVEIWPFCLVLRKASAYSKALNLQYSLQANMTCVLQANNPNIPEDESYNAATKCRHLAKIRSIAPIWMSIVPRKLEHNTVAVQFNVKETKQGIYAGLATSSI